MVWNSETNPEAQLLVNCAGTDYNATGLSGVGLVEKLKQIARDNGISKFDVFDADGDNLGPEEIETGNFTAPLKLVRFNAAA